MRYLAHITLLLTVLLSASALAADIPPPGELSSLQRAHYEHRAGYHLHIAEEYEAALKRYEISAATGLAKSENAIGRILGFDRKPVQDLPAALPWFIRAAAPRDVHQGYGFAESQRQAKETLNWYCKNGAGEFPDTHPFAKDPKCWHGRGKALMYGWFGMRKDREAARALFEKSIAAGWSDAQVTLDKLNARPAPRLKMEPINKGKLALLLFLLLVMGMVFRDYRVRRFIFGWLYKNSA